jgi:protein O-GlcNAc transferase
MSLEKEIKEAFDLHSLGKFDSALIKYEKILNKYKNNGNVLQLMGSLFLQIGNHEKSIKYLLKAKNELPKFPEIDNNLALAYKNLNNIEKSEYYALKAIEIKKNYDDPYFFLLSLYIESRKFNEAKKLIEKRTDLNKNKIYLNNKGIILAELGDILSSIDNFSKAIELDKNYAECINNLANAYIKIENYYDALEYINKALIIDPKKIEFLKTKIIILNFLKKYSEAKDILNLIYDKSSPDYFYLMGLQSSINKEYEKSIDFYKKALDLDSNNIEIYNNLGLAYYENEQYDFSIEIYLKGLHINKNHPFLIYNLANTFSKKKQYDEADKYYQIGLKIDGARKELLNNYSTLKYAKKEYENAIELASKCIETDSEYLNAYINRGMAFERIGNYKLAFKDYKKAHEIKYLKENINSCIDQMMMSSRYMCNWVEYSKLKDQLESNFITNEFESVPLSTLATFDEPKYQRLSVQSWSKRLESIRTIELQQRTIKNERLRIAYISCDFNNHPVSFLISELLEIHDRNNFEIFAFSYGAPTFDAYYNRISDAVDKFIDVSAISDREIVDLIRSTNIDIAIDLSGFTHGCRTEIFKYRVAPIQISYLGYMGTMGLDCIDYIIADKYLITDEQQKFLAEKIIHLPVYQASDSRRRISNKFKNKKYFNLPENTFIYCSFNNSYKITPVIFDAWMEILIKNINSVLFLYEENIWQKENLINEAKRNGVDVDRIIFSGKVPLENYLERFTFADLFLDTFPYNAGTTANDSLFAELPILTLSGKSIVSRMAGSLLTSMDLDELISYSIEEYISLAVKLGTDIDFYSKIKEKVSIGKRNSLLFNSFKFKNSIECAYIKAHENFLNNTSEDIYIEIDDIEKYNLTLVKKENKSVDLNILPKKLLKVTNIYNNSNTTTNDFLNWNQLIIEMDSGFQSKHNPGLLKLKAIPSESIDAVFSLNNLEYLFPHEIPFILSEFLRVLKVNGYLIVTCPDLKSISEIIADDNLTEPINNFHDLSITALDLIYGNSKLIAKGELNLAKHCGFTEKVLSGTLKSLGFESIASISRSLPHYDLWAIATKEKKSEAELLVLIKDHFPSP